MLLSAAIFSMYRAMEELERRYASSKAYVDVRRDPVWRSAIFSRGKESAWMSIWSTASCWSES